MDLNSIGKGCDFQKIQLGLEYGRGMAKKTAPPPWHADLNAAFEKSEMSMRALSDLSGVAYDTVNKVLRGEVQKPRGNTLERLFTALKVGEQYVPEGLLPSAAVKQGVIPVVGYVAAGVWLEYNEDREEPVEWFPFDLPNYPKGSVYAYRVQGDSIDKVAPDGATLVCVDLAKTGLSLNDGDLAIVERRRHQEGLREITAKRVRRTDDQLMLVPESTNPRWQTTTFMLSDTAEDLEIRALAKVEYVLKRP